MIMFINQNITAVGGDLRKDLLLLNILGCVGLLWSLLLLKQVS